MLKQLPLCNPILNFVPETNYIFSIIDGKSPVFEYFIFENFTQICSIFHPEWNALVSRFIDDFSRTYLSSKCLNHFFIPNEDLDYIHSDISQIIKKAIDSSYYVLLCIDKLYIHEYRTNRHVSHTAMVYGYDDSNASYLIRDFFDGVYRNAACPGMELEQAIINYPMCNTTFPYAGILGVKTKNCFEETPDYALFSNNLLSLQNDFFLPNTISYGLGSWFSAFGYAIDSRCSISSMIMNLHFLFQHIFLMGLRVKRLLIRFPFLDLQQENTYLENLQREITLYKNKLLKHTMLHGDMLLDYEIQKWRQITNGLKENYCSSISRIIRSLRNINCSSTHYRYI